MPIPVCNGDKICGGVTIGVSTLDLSTIDSNTVELSPEEVPYSTGNVVVIIYGT